MAKKKLASNGRLYEPKLFVVEGTGRFPWDMLRYDTCWPHREGQDSPALSGDLDAPKRRVYLRTYNPSAPTAARWHSQGWEVVDGDARPPEWNE